MQPKLKQQPNPYDPAASIAEPMIATKKNLGLGHFFVFMFYLCFGECCALIYQIIQPKHKNATKLMLNLSFLYFFVAFHLLPELNRQRISFQPVLKHFVIYSEKRINVIDLMDLTMEHVYTIMTRVEWNVAYTCSHTTSFRYAYLPGPPQ